jgi:hypothetical protein
MASLTPTLAVCFMVVTHVLACQRWPTWHFREQCEKDEQRTLDEEDVFYLETTIKTYQQILKFLSTVVFPLLVALTLYCCMDSSLSCVLFVFGTMNILLVCLYHWLLFWINDSTLLAL